MFGQTFFEFYSREHFIGSLVITHYTIIAILDFTNITISLLISV